MLSMEQVKALQNIRGIQSEHKKTVFGNNQMHLQGLN